MKTTYLKEFINYSDKKIAYIPVGTLEWHGNHLPIETDFMVAQKVCEILSKKVPGYVLPPIYLGSGTKKKINGKWLIGMDKYLGKKLSGNLYFLEPDFFAKVLVSLGNNLMNQGFEKIFVIAGHSGKGQRKALLLANKKLNNLVIVDIYDTLDERSMNIEHADENETSLLWACYPEEETKSRKIKIDKNNDYFKFIGYDPREKASLKLGNRILKWVIKDLNKKIK
jgi:creatinine amidohydrolase